MVTQGSSFLATLGRRTQSRCDWEGGCAHAVWNSISCDFISSTVFALIWSFCFSERGEITPRPATIPKLFVWFCSETGETRAPTLSASISVDQRLKKFRDLTLIPALRSRRRGKLVCAPYVLL